MSVKMNLAVKKKPSKVLPAFTVMRVAGGWSFVKLELDEDLNVLTRSISEPDTKPIITERFKIEVGKYWSRIDEQNI